MGGMPWHEARIAAHAAVSRLPAERVALRGAVGRVLWEDLLALGPVPHYASSAMDGWAVTGSSPWRLVDAAPGVLQQGEAVPIVTGGVIPGGARGVLRRENGVVSVEDGHLVLSLAASGAPGEPRPGMHVRDAGTEAVAGELVFRAGTLLNPAHVAVAAACGHDRLAVAPRLRIGLVLTGDEVVEHGIPGPGQVRDSFGPTLPALVADLGGDVIAQRRVGDSFAATLQAFVPASAGIGADPAVEAGAGSLLAAQVLITTGGTGESPADQVRAALLEAGATFVVGGVDVRPGGPSFLARLPDGRFVVGLPGNPLAGFLGLLTLAHPLISAFQGLPLPPLGRTVTAVELPGVRANTVLRPYRLVGGEAQPTAWHGSGMLRGLAEADGVLVCPGAGAHAGAMVETLPLPW
jgi:molybdopterin molybdotransferase